MYIFEQKNGPNSVSKVNFLFCSRILVKIAENSHHIIRLTPGINFMNHFRPKVTDKTLKRPHEFVN
jgi:hypothetical protein